MAEPTKTNSGKPLNIIPYKDKEKDNQQWYKDTADYYISNSSFGITASSSNTPMGKQNMELLYLHYLTCLVSLEYFQILPPYSLNSYELLNHV